MDPQAWLDGAGSRRHTVVGASIWGFPKIRVPILRVATKPHDKAHDTFGSVLGRASRVLIQLQYHLPQADFGMILVAV